MIDYAASIVKPKKLVKRAMLLKGPSGTGKTYQYALLHEAGLKGLYACVGEHMGTIEDLDPPTWYIHNPDVALTPAEKSPEQQDFMRLMDYLRSDQHEFDFLYFDSLMNFADELLFYLKHTKRFSGFELWGMFGEKMKQALKLLVSLTQPRHPKPVHVIATWGVEVGQDWEGRRAIVPIVDGKVVGPRIDYAFDDVLMLRRAPDTEGKAQYVAYTQGTHEFDAKVSKRGEALPAVIADPNLARIIARIES